MNRVDLALARELHDWADEGEDIPWLLGCGRDIKRRARLSASCTLHRLSTAITARVEGWRRMGAPKGFAFGPWSTMSDEAFRHQLHVAASRGSETAVRQLSQALVSDLANAAEFAR